MKTFTLALLTLIAVACASGGDANTPTIPMQLDQIGPGGDVYYFGGPVSVQYRLTVTNPTSEPLTLTRVELQTIGPGAYVLRRVPTTLNIHLSPNETRAMDLNAWADAPGGRANSETPVTVRAVTYFDRPSGHFIRILNTIISPR